MTTDQILPAALAAAILILAIVAIGRVTSRRRGSNESAFGAGGTPTVPLGTIGVSKTVLAPSGVVHVVGEQWTATSGDGSEIPSGHRVRVVGQDGLTLVVEADSSGVRS